MDACSDGMYVRRINPLNRGQEQCAWSTLERTHLRVARTQQAQPLTHVMTTIRAQAPSMRDL